MAAPLTVLCIDDDSQIRYALSQMCRSQQWRPLLAQSTEEGVAMFDAERADIVLIDYHLPGANGVEGVRQLRRRSSHTPIIVFTIDDDQSVADAFLQAGANDFALKPIKALDLISRIKLHIRLMESERLNLYGESGRKGVSGATVNLILQALSDAPEGMTVEAIARNTGLATQTAYRYLQHLAGDRRVLAENVYGKVGRPKMVFRIEPEEKP
ncbi:MAG: response regulator [Oscillospiraceae bacterium]|nr:response regulator [Oscillospiraceae bacterium]